MKKSIEEIFESYEHLKNPVGKVAKRGPMYTHFENADVVFIGINPSFPKGRAAKEKPYSVKRAVTEYPSHYKKFSDLATAINQESNWTYIDALQLRETNQTEVFNLMKHDGGLEFIIEQLRFTIQTLEQINPKLIIVCNGGARSFFGIDAKNGKNIWMGFDFEGKNDLGEYCMNDNGCYVIKGLQPNSLSDKDSTCLNGTKIIFTDNLKYMGKSTRENLIWQITKSLMD